MRAIAIALTGFLVLAGLAQAHLQPALAQSAAPDDDDDGPDTPPQPAAAPHPSAAAPESQDDKPTASQRLGDSRRVDPFDANDDHEVRGRRSSHLTTADPDQGAIVCIAGCDTPPSPKR